MTKPVSFGLLRFSPQKAIGDLMTNMLARKQQEFDLYARDSALANSSVEAKDTSDEALAKVFVMKERERLKINSENKTSIEEED